MKALKNLIAKQKVGLTGQTVKRKEPVATKEAFEKKEPVKDDREEKEPTKDEKEEIEQLFDLEHLEQGKRELLTKEEQKTERLQIKVKELETDSRDPASPKAIKDI